MDGGDDGDDGRGGVGDGDDGALYKSIVKGMGNGCQMEKLC